MVGGTAGAGKSRFSAMLCSAIPGSTCVEVNEIVERYKLYSKRDRFKTRIVEPRRLQRALRREIAGKSRLVVIVGHLAVEVNVGADVAVIVRARLRDIESRLKKRRYPLGKMAENIISEAVDYSGEIARAAFKEVYEVRSEHSKRAVIRYISERQRGRAPKPPEAPQINNMRELLNLIKDGNRYGL